MAHASQTKVDVFLLALEQYIDRAVERKADDSIEAELNRMQASDDLKFCFSEVLNSIEVN